MRILEKYRQPRWKWLLLISVWTGVLVVWLVALELVVMALMRKGGL